MNHPLRCRCGTLSGTVSHPEKVSRGVCYCRDCQAYAHFLGKPGDVLDEMGGTDVIATLPKYVSFTQGLEQLACMSLTDKGMFRWYARCCNTAIGNTPRDIKLCHVGLIHTCLESSSESLDDAFGPVRMRVNTKSAKGKPKTMPVSMFKAILRFMKSLLQARLDGSYKTNPFFAPGGQGPIVPPKVLTRSEWEQLMKTV